MNNEKEDDDPNVRENSSTNNNYFLKTGRRFWLYLQIKTFARHSLQLAETSYLIFKLGWRTITWNNKRSDIGLFPDFTCQTHSPVTLLDDWPGCNKTHKNNVRKCKLSPEVLIITMYPIRLWLIIIVSWHNRIWQLNPHPICQIVFIMLNHR